LNLCTERALRMPCEKRHFFSNLYIKTIVLPRQAQDKHRENSKKMPFFAPPSHGTSVFVGRSPGSTAALS
jgi:hypothetical protein